MSELGHKTVYNVVLRKFLRIYDHWESNYKGQLRRSMTKSPMFLICCFICLCVIHEVIRSLYELLLFI